MICIEQHKDHHFFIWADGGGKIPIELSQLDPVILERFHMLEAQHIGVRIEDCGARLMANLFLIYDESD